MNNRSLIRKIEKAASVYIKASGNKMLGDTRYEAYVDAYGMIDGVQSRVPKETRYSWCADERGYAVRNALIQIADALNVTITDDERNAVERAETANNEARMYLYTDTH